MLAKNKNIIIITVLIFIAFVISINFDKGSARGLSVAAVKDVRIAGDLEKTRFVIELSRVVKYKYSTLLNPYRVVIDLPQVKFQIKQKKQDKGLVKGFRYGHFTKDKSRIVIDTKKPVKIQKIFTLRPNRSYPARLVVDIVSVKHQKMKQIVASKYVQYNQNEKVEDDAIIKILKKNSLDFTKKFVVVIDPGHGGIDPGAVGKNKVLEKNIVLDFAKKIKRELERKKRYVVYLTRNKDYFVSLDDRIKIARKYKADLFLSLHIDSIDKQAKSVKGITVYNLSKKASDKHAEKLAKRENKSDLIAGLDIITASTQVKSIIIELAQRESKIFSEEFSQTLVKELLRHKVLNKNPRRSAGFHVLKAPDIPSILIELGYISNNQDRKKLVSNKYRDKVANGIVKSIEAYFYKYEQYSKR